MVQKDNQQILEGSHAIALTIKNIKPDVISAFPITPQTHIVEDLAKFKANGEADYEYLRAESEFAAASIVLGASAAGARVYTATSSQGLLLMLEVIYNIAGMRLPIVMTCANRSVSAPINIWNDQQDAVTARDSGWIMLYAENNQEAVDQHIMAYKIAEKLKLPVMVNVDGFVLTHTYEPVMIPDEKSIKKYLPAYKPEIGQFLDVKNPITMGAFARPSHYMEIRQDLHEDLRAAIKTINEEYSNYQKQILQATSYKLQANDNGLFEYYGHKNPKTILVAMGSVVGTIKEKVDELNKKHGFPNAVGVLKIKTFRPFPSKEILEILDKAKNIAVMDKSISLGSIGPLATEIKTACQGILKTNIRSFVVGLGGRDITGKMIEKIIKEADKKNDEATFVGN